MSTSIEECNHSVGVILRFVRYEEYKKIEDSRIDEMYLTQIEDGSLEDYYDQWTHSLFEQFQKLELLSGETLIISAGLACTKLCGIVSIDPFLGETITIESESDEIELLHLATKMIITLIPLFVSAWEGGMGYAMRADKGSKNQLPL